MGLVKKDIFVCVDIEATGLDLTKDRIIEIAAAKFTFEGILDTFETLVDPLCPIPDESIKIHNITYEMVRGKPTINQVLPEILKFMDNHIIVGHGISFDIAMISLAAEAHSIPCKIKYSETIDTLRLARLYGQSPINSLEMLRAHFNIPPEGAHRAMNDVNVNIEVFKHLSKNFTTTEDILRRLQRPVLLKAMPLGKHKGRYFKEIPVEYLRWAAKQNFDQDLLFSIRSELKKRKEGSQFYQASNPFSSL